MIKYLCLVWLFLCTSVYPCAVFFDTEGTARVEGERSLLVWNPDTKTQHFIRKVHFLKNSSSFGFVVPVPSLPEVADFNSEVFGYLDAKRIELIPKSYEATKLVSFIADLITALSSHDGVMGSTLNGGRSVEEHSSFQLRSYEAKIISATHIEPMKDWLMVNDFQATPEGLEWINVYIEKKWYFVAFKFTGEQKEVSTDVIRISVKTDKPYYPYREPKHAPSTEYRALNFDFLSPQTFMPDFLLDPSLPSAEGWERTPVLSTEIDLNEELKNLIGNKNAVLTRWNDFTKDRPDRDITFEKANIPRILPSERNVVDISIPVIITAVIGLLFILRRVFKKKPKQLTKPIKKNRQIKK